MAKQRQPRAHVETRKETARRRRDAEQNRRVIIGLIGVGLLLVILIGAGLIQELVIKPRQPVAIVNGAAITLQDYRKRVLFNWFQSGQPVTDPQGTSLDVLDQMIDEQLLREEARKRGIVVSPDEVTEAVEKVFGYLRVPPTPAPTPTPPPTATPGGEFTPTPLPTPRPTATLVSLAAYQEALKNYLQRLNQATGMSEADFRALIEADLLRQKLYDVVTAEVPTTEEQVRARHILVRIQEPLPTPTPLPEGEPTPTPNPSPQPTPEPRDEAQALARITEVKQKLDAGEDFAELARTYSDDTYSAEKGGDLGWFGRGQMVPEFEEAAFALQPGQVSEPVKTVYGYHLIKVEERDPARPLDEFTLLQRKYEAFNAWLSQVRSQAKIERNWSLDKVPPTPAALPR
jgi:parvulin-like peptidyl-prolyl isomerase